MSDLIAKLRDGSLPTDQAWPVMLEAADEIERLRATFNQTYAAVACKCGYGVACKAWDERGDRIESLQAKLDAVMMEYCPDEMTAEQVAEWRRHQVPGPSTRAVERQETEGVDVPTRAD